MARRRARRDQVPTVEWITGLIGLAIVVAILGAIGWEAIRGGTTQPALEITLEAVTEGPAGYIAGIVVRNASRQAAADVLVEGRMRAAGGGEARSEVRLDYVPGLSERRAVLTFPSRPQPPGLALRVLGYTTP